MSKKVKAGDRVRLTGWSKYYESIEGPTPDRLFIQSGYNFPIESETYIAYGGMQVLKDWDISNFEYEIIEPTEKPIFKDCTTDQFNYQCKKWNIEPAPGVQPQTLQAVLHAPDSTPMVFFICHLDAINVTIHDGEVNAIIHD